MDVLNSSNSFQTANQFQTDTTAPNFPAQIAPNEQTGNAVAQNQAPRENDIRDSQSVTRTSETGAPRTNIDPGETRAIQEAQRESATNDLATQTQRSQIAINIAEGEQNRANPVEERTAQAVNNFQNEQRQENANQGVQAYQESLNTPVNNLARGIIG